MWLLWLVVVLVEVVAVLALALLWEAPLRVESSFRHSLCCWLLSSRQGLGGWLSWGPIRGFVDGRCVLSVVLVVVVALLVSIRPPTLTPHRFRLVFLGFESASLVRSRLSLLGWIRPLWFFNRRAFPSLRRLV
jgi:hypothetical protein